MKTGNLNGKLRYSAWIRVLACVMAALLILLGFLFYSATGHLHVVNFDPTATEPPAPLPYKRAILILLFMAGGIVFSSLYEQLQRVTGSINIVVELKTALNSAHFWKAVLVSPIVFAGVYLASKSEPDYVVGSLLAFQNGFFCDAIFRQHSTE